MDRFSKPGYRFAVIVAASAVVGCGGGVVALLPFVTPVGGSWSLDTVPSTAVTDFAAGDESFNINPKAGQPYMLDSPLQVTGTYRSDTAATQCAGAADTAVEGSADDGDLVLRAAADPATVCLRGTFTDLATFRADDDRVYRNSRVDVQLPIGVWVSDDGTRRIKFTAPTSVDNGDTADVTGCDVAAGSAFEPITGTLQGLVPAGFPTPGTPPRMAELKRDGVTLYTHGVMLDGATFEFDAAGGAKVRLRRLASVVDACP